jgi:hypothetical protein
MRSLVLLISNPAPNREDRGEIAKGVNLLGRTRYQVGNGLITGQMCPYWVGCASRGGARLTA